MSHSQDSNTFLVPQRQYFKYTDYTSPTRARRKCAYTTYVSYDGQDPPPIPAGDEGDTSEGDIWIQLNPNPVHPGGLGKVWVRYTCMWIEFRTYSGEYNHPSAIHCTGRILGIAKSKKGLQWLSSNRRRHLNTYRDIDHQVSVVLARYAAERANAATVNARSPARDYTFINESQHSILRWRRRLHTCRK